MACCLGRMVGAQRCSVDDRGRAVNAWAKPGVKCVCIKRGEWINGANACIEDKHPYFKEVCEVEYVTEGKWGVMLKLAGYADFYAVYRFRPFITPTQEEDLAIFRPLLVTEGVDA